MPDALTGCAGGRRERGLGDVLGPRLSGQRFVESRQLELMIPRQRNQIGIGYLTRALEGGQGVSPHVVGQEVCIRLGNEAPEHLPGIGKARLVRRTHADPKEAGFDEGADVPGRSRHKPGAGFGVAGVRLPAGRQQ